MDKEEAKIREKILTENQMYLMDIFKRLEVLLSELDEMTTNGTYITSPHGGIGINLKDGSSHINIDNCYFHEIGQWMNRLPFSGSQSITGSGVSLQDNDDITISNCEFTRMKTGVSIKTLTQINNIKIYNSSFHNYSILNSRFIIIINL